MAPRISLCMIVRDEEAALPRFLEHARGLWDELVAVDTGSVDRTPALLEAAGARVLHEPWRDDFAAARNVSMEAAAGDWILVLDADELAPPGLAAALRAAAADADAGAASILLRSRLPGGHLHDTRLLRAFRRDPAVRYRHAIHEDVTDDVLSRLAATGRRLVHLPGAVEHLGYVRSRAAARGKRARDARILQAVIAADPGDLYARYKLLEQARFWSDRVLWASAARDAAPFLDADPGWRAAHYAGDLVALVADGLHPAAPRAALALLDAWAPRLPPSAPLLLRRGQLREVLGVAGAEEDFLRCLGLADRTAHQQLATVRPLLGLARLALARGDVAGASRRIEEALALAPSDREALLAAAALQRLTGGGAALLAFSAAHARTHGASPELHAAVGEAALLAGDLPTALGALGAAAGDPPAGPDALRLAQALLAAGDLAAARALAERLAPEQPEAALGVLLCDLAEGRDSALDVDLEQDAADTALRAWIAAVRAGRHPALLDALRRAAPAVAEAFPWLPGALG